MKRSISIAFAAAALMVAGHASAATCEVTVEGTDSMKFNTKEIVVDKSCKEFKVTLKHVGKLPKAAMGHNWVLVKTADFSAASKDLLAAGAAKDYMKADDARVIAHTKLLGGGESDTVTFSTSKLKAGEEYTFFCSYPGHSALMKGTLKF